jgi:hypothetical protein
MISGASIFGTRVEDRLAAAGAVLFVKTGRKHDSR